MKVPLQLRLSRSITILFPTLTFPFAQVFAKNATACPKTCYNKDHHHACERRVESCTCAEGLVLSYNLTCVREESCPCKHGGKLYETGETIDQGCNKCVCREGHWTCGTEPCNAVCVAQGDPHYTTYDGHRFSYKV